VVFKIPNAADERPGFEIDHPAPRRLEIVAQPPPQILGLSHVNNPPKPVEHEIHTGLVRNIPEAGIEIWFFAKQVIREFDGYHAVSAARSKDEIRLQPEF